MVVRIVNAPAGIAAYKKRAKVDELVARGDAEWVGQWTARYTADHLDRIVEQSNRPKEFFGGREIEGTVIEVPYHPVATGHQGLSGASGFRTWQYTG